MCFNCNSCLYCSTFVYTDLVKFFWRWTIATFVCYRDQNFMKLPKSPVAEAPSWHRVQTTVTFEPVVGLTSYLDTIHRMLSSFTLFTCVQIRIRYDANPSLKYPNFMSQMWNYASHIMTDGHYKSKNLNFKLAYFLAI